MIELFTFNMADFHFTEASEGEKIRRYETIQEKVNFVFRLKSKSFHFYTQEQEFFDLTVYLQENYEPRKFIDRNLFTNQKISASTYLCT